MASTWEPTTTNEWMRKMERRVAALERRVGIGAAGGSWISTGGIFVAMTGWSLNSYSVRIDGNTVWVRYLEVTRTGAAINGNAGDIGNTGMVTIADARFIPVANFGGLSAAASGRLAAATASSTGQIVLTAVAAGLTDSTAVVPQNSIWSFSGAYPAT